MLKDSHATLAELLAVAADRHGLHPEDVVRFEDIRDEFDIPASVPAETIEEAHLIMCRNLRRLKQMIGQKTTEKPSASVHVPVAPNRPKTGARALVFGKYSVTSVLRWMGAQRNWDPNDAALAVETLTLKKVSDITVRLQMAAGITGARGPAAPVTEQEAIELREATK